LTITGRLRQTLVKMKISRSSKLLFHTEEVLEIYITGLETKFHKNENKQSYLIDKGCLT
jgi:hypothetical protein